MASIMTHNGILTVKSLRTGDHRTFKIETMPADGTFAPGERVVSLLVGSDNDHAYRGFGFLKIVNGTPWINVWTKCRGQQFDALAIMLEQLDAHEAAKRVEISFATTCRRCNRTLTTPDSIEKGIGPICEKLAA